MKTGIVCEGGGMRGIYTAGVLQAFMNEHYMADELIGVSAGASNGVSYVSNQSERGMRTNIDYIGDKQYLSLRNYIKTGSVFGMDYLFDEIPHKLDPFDYESFYASPCDFYAGATNLLTGQCEYFGKKDITWNLEAIQASCSLPLLSKKVEINGIPYMDGGISNPIPLDKALDDGCDRLIIILTRDRSYRKKPEGPSVLYRSFYRKYPNFVRSLKLRHLVYNHTLERIQRLEKSGKAIVVAPEVPLAVDRFAQDKDQLLSAYYDGLSSGQKTLKIL